jgi:hypothetical protein
MKDVATASGFDGSEAVDQWSARKIQPIVLLYLVLVIAAFMAASRFIFHSSEAVTALAIAFVCAVAATVPGILEKVEYRSTETGVEKRPVKNKKTEQFKTVFRWDELSSIVPMRHGFKFYKTMDESSRLRRFWKTHVSDQFSGEIHVERKDLERILEIAERQGISFT